MGQLFSTRLCRARVLNNIIISPFFDDFVHNNKENAETTASWLSSDYLYINYLKVGMGKKALSKMFEVFSKTPSLGLVMNIHRILSSTSSMTLFFM